MNTESVESYTRDYDGLLSNDEGYQFFVKAQLAIPKIAKKNNDGLFFGFVSFVMSHLQKIGNAESSIAIIDVALREFIKAHSTVNEGDHPSFVKTFIDYYKLIPGKCNQTHFKITFLQFCEKCKVKEELLQQAEVYLLFAIDSIKNGEKVIGYRFALKSEDYDSIICSLESLGSSIQDKNEMDYLITRTLFELIILKNLPLAQRVLTKYFPSLGENINASPPVLNFGYLLLQFLKNEEKSYEKLTKFTNCYKSIIDKEKTFKQYLNMISKIYFNKALNIASSGGFSFLNILKSLAGS